MSSGDAAITAGFAPPARTDPIPRMIDCTGVVPAAIAVAVASAAITRAFLQSLDVAAVERFLSELTSGRSAKTVRNVHGVLSAALVDALRWKLVSHNAATGALLPKLERRPPRAWSSAQTTLFLARAE